MDEEGFTVLGGQAESIAETLGDRYEDGLSLDAAVKLGAAVLGDTDAQPLAPEQLEVGVLQRAAVKRAFRRIKGDELVALLGS